MVVSGGKDDEVAGHMACGGVRTQEMHTVSFSRIYKFIFVVKSVLHFKFWQVSQKQQAVNPTGLVWTADDKY